MKKKTRKAHNKGKKLFYWCKWFEFGYDVWGEHYTLCRNLLNVGNMECKEYKNLKCQFKCPYFEKSDCKEYCDITKHEKSVDNKFKM